MDPKVILPSFLKAGIKVLGELANCRFSHKKVYTQTGNPSLGEIKIEIPIHGDIQTRVVFDLPKPFAYRLAQAMTGEMENPDQELMQSAILELGNMISGNAMGFLEESKIHCDIKPPKTLIGQQESVFAQGTRLGVIEFTGELGDFNLYLVMEEGKAEPPEILLYQLPDNLSQWLAEFFIPRGFKIYALDQEKEFIQALKGKNLNLVLAQAGYQGVSAFQKILEKMSPDSHGIRFIFYSSPQDWDPKLPELFPGRVLGYLPRHFDAPKVAQALLMILNKIGISFNRQRKQVRVTLSAQDSATAIIPNPKEDSKNQDPTLNLPIEDLSVGGALLALEHGDQRGFSPGQVLPRCQLKLKGFMVRTRLRVIQVSPTGLSVQFLEIPEEDQAKISYFIHQKLAETLRKH